MAEAARKRSEHVAEYKGVLATIGNTPVIEVRNIDTGPCRLFLKLENQNPGGSIKDRIALKMVEAAERDGRLKPGGTIVEATAGNTGIGLALIAGQKGYKLVLVIPDKMSNEKIFLLRAMGVEVVQTRSDVGKGHPEYYQDIAERMANERGAFYVNQFSNEANSETHETWTGPELWEDMNHDVDAVVSGIGSGGTMTGLGRFFKKTSPSTEMILADPIGSILTPLVKTGKMTEVGSWLIEGIGEDFIPSICDMSLIKDAYAISDKDSYLAARELLQKEGILGGSSTGTLLAAALRYCREQKTPKKVVTFVCDTGNKYLSKVYNDFFLIDQGMQERTKTNDLRDMIMRRYKDGAVICASPDDSVFAAYKRMRSNDVSQLPVVKDKKLVGIIGESDILGSINLNERNFSAPVSSCMTSKLETLEAKASTNEVLSILNRGMVAIIMHEGEFEGIITKMDFINFLKRRAENVR